MNPGPLNMPTADDETVAALLEESIAIEQPTERERRAWRESRLIDCPRCHGDGEIGVAGYSHNPNCGFATRDPQCDTTARCPDCHGTGTVHELEKEPAPLDTAGLTTHEE